MKGVLKKCPSCGSFFACQGEEDCWCESYQISKKNFLYLKEKYTDCICRECLKAYTDI
jgi:hypothetical protein